MKQMIEMLQKQMSDMKQDLDSVKKELSQLTTQDNNQEINMLKNKVSQITQQLDIVDIDSVKKRMQEAIDITSEEEPQEVKIPSLKVTLSDEEKSRESQFQQQVKDILDQDTTTQESEIMPKLLSITKPCQDKKKHTQDNRSNIYMGYLKSKN